MERYKIDCIEKFEFAMIRYVMSLQSIMLYMEDSDDVLTPYGLENIRANNHQGLINVMHTLKPYENIDRDDLYLRTKDILGNLDKVWNWGNAMCFFGEFDITTDEGVVTMVAFLEDFFLSDDVIEYLNNGDKNLLDKIWQKEK